MAKYEKQIATLKQTLKRQEAKVQSTKELIALLESQK